MKYKYIITSFTKPVQYENLRFMHYLLRINAQRLKATGNDHTLQRLLEVHLSSCNCIYTKNDFWLLATSWYSNYFCAYLIIGTCEYFASKCMYRRHWWKWIHWDDIHSIKAVVYTVWLLWYKALVSLQHISTQVYWRTQFQGMCYLGISTLALGLS